MLVILGAEETDEDEEEEEVTPKSLKGSSKKDGELSFLFFLAKELHMTVCELQERMTYEELALWSAYYEWTADMQREAQRKAQKRRR